MNNVHSKRNRLPVLLIEEISKEDAEKLFEAAKNTPTVVNRILSNPQKMETKSPTLSIER